MRKFLRTLAVLSVGAMMIVPTWPAQASGEQIPTTCTTVSIQNGWDVNGKETNDFWVGEDGWLYHHGTGYWQAHGDTYCTGFWYGDGYWRIDDPTMQPPFEGYLWGTFRIELSDPKIDGGFEASYTGQFVWEGDTIWEGELSGQGYGDLQGWQIRMSIWNGEVATGYVFHPGG